MAETELSYTSAAKAAEAGKPVLFFDTTLRDGEQSPGCSLKPADKVRIAHQLARLGVDIIEAGFPASSRGDREAVERVAREVRGPVISGLARCREEDIRTCWSAVRHAARPRIHTFLSTSDIHLEHQLRMSREEAVALARRMVALAASLCPADVQFSAMDATRSDLGFLAAVTKAAIEAGATTVNLSDTVGYMMPSECSSLIDLLRVLVPNSREVVLSVHCHDDLGLATANTLAAIECGVEQVEVAVNGLGERAGVAALEEVAMILVTRGESLGRHCTIATEEIARTSELVAGLTGQAVQSNKAIVGKNAFVHESGIHQDGVVKHRSTYEIMRPEDVGFADSAGMVLGKHSGRRALRFVLETMDVRLRSHELDEMFIRFKELADSRKEVSPAELRALVSDVTA